MNLMRKLNQTATIWQNPIPSPSQYGKFSFDLPRVIFVRWEDTAELFIDRTTGRETVSRAVILMHPDEMAREGDMIALGDYGANSNPYNTPALPIRSYTAGTLLSGKPGTLKVML